MAEGRRSSERRGWAGDLILDQIRKKRVTGFSAGKLIPELPTACAVVGEGQKKKCRPETAHPLAGRR